MATILYDGKGNPISLTAEAKAVDYDRIMRSVNHRGYNTIAPENTLPAFKLSKAQGFNYVECDLDFTADGVPVLLHDGTIDRTSDGTGSVGSLTYEQLLQYDFGSWKSEAYAGTKIPTLEEFALLCRKIGLHPYIEIKGTLTAERASILVNIVKSVGLDVTWISFGAANLSAIKAVDETARLGFIHEGEITSAVIATAEGLKTDSNEVFLDCNYSYFTDSGVSLAIDAGIPLEVWTVNTEAAVLGLNDYITGVTSDSIIAGKVIYDEVTV